MEKLTRYLGGMLSTIDLLEYGIAGPGVDKDGLLAIQKQAEILARKLGPGYAMPYLTY
jgi:hypothetical protein